MSRTIKPSLRQLRILICIMLVFIILLTPWGQPGVRGLRSMFQPLGTALYRLGLESSPLAQPYVSQKQQQKAAQTDRLERENQQLRAQLGFKKQSPYTTVGADVIGRSNQATRRVLIINRGRNDGIKSDQAVLADGYLVGVVEKVHESTAQVQLITDPDFRMIVSVGTSRTPGIARGSLGGLEVGRLLANEHHALGDTVYSSNIDNQVPGGIPLGIVRNLRDSETLFREAIVESPVAVEQIQLVLVVVQ